MVSPGRLTSAACWIVANGLRSVPALASEPVVATYQAESKTRGSSPSMQRIRTSSNEPGQALESDNDHPRPSEPPSADTGSPPANPVRGIIAPAQGTNPSENPADRPSAGDTVLQASDAELVRLIREGDQAAFRELVNRHGESLYGLACSVMGSTADAEDILQETFLGAFRRLGAFEGRSSVKTWLVRILLNHASKLRRSKKVRKAASLPDQVGPSDARDGAVETSSPASAVESKIDLDAMLGTLSPEHREVIVLRELQQLSYDEIAAALHIPFGMVESGLHRARQELKKRYEGYLT